MLVFSFHGLSLRILLCWFLEIWFVEQATISPVILTAACGAGILCMMQARKAVESHALLPY